MSLNRYNTTGVYGAVWWFTCSVPPYAPGSSTNTERANAVDSTESNRQKRRKVEQQERACAMDVQTDGVVVVVVSGDRVTEVNTGGCAERLLHECALPTREE